MHKLEQLEKKYEKSFDAASDALAENETNEDKLKKKCRTYQIFLNIFCC